MIQRYLILVLAIWLVRTILGQNLHLHNLSYDSTEFISISKAPLIEIFTRSSKPPLFPCLLRLVEASPTETIFWQSVVSALALSYLLSVLWFIWGNKSGSIGAIVILMIFASLPNLVLWNNSLLSESLSISTFLMTLASLLLYLQRVRVGNGTSFCLISSVALYGSLVCFALARDSNIPVAFFTGAVVIVKTWWMFRSGNHWVLPASLGLVLIISSILCGLAAKSNGRGQPQIVHNLFSRILPYESGIEFLRSEGMPVVAGIDGKSYGKLSPTHPLISDRQVQRWSTRFGSKAILKYYILNPSSLISVIWKDLPRTLDSVNWYYRINWRLLSNWKQKLSAAAYFPTLWLYTVSACYFIVSLIVVARKKYRGPPSPTLVWTNVNSYPCDCA